MSLEPTIIDWWAGTLGAQLKTMVPLFTRLSVASSWEVRVGPHEPFPILKWLLTGPILYRLHAGDCSLLWVRDCHGRAMPREWYLTALPPSSDLQSFCLLFYKVPELLERVVVVPDYSPSQSSTSSWTHLCPCARASHLALVTIDLPS